MAVTISPNMSLPIPVVGSEPGPQYATDVDSCLTIVDGHTHTPGSGVPITSAAININSPLTFQSNFATNVAGVNLIAQSSTPTNNTVYESGVDLWYVDGLGNNIQITANGGIAGSPGNISNLTSPASASYVSPSSTFVWQSDIGIAANMDFGSAILRNLSPNSTFGLTLQPPTLSSNYTITLPTLPASQKIMTLDNTGIMAAPYTVDGSTITISSNVIGIPAGGITTTQIAAHTITENNLELRPTASTATAGQIALSSSCGTFTLTSTNVNTDITNLNVTITTTGRPVRVALQSDGGAATMFAPPQTGALIEIIILRGVSQIGAYQVGNGGGASAVAGLVPTSSVLFLDFPTAGTYTYKAQMRMNSAGGGNFSQMVNTVLVAYEI